MLQRCTFHVYYYPNLINNTTNLLSTPIEFLSPRVFQFPNDELGDSLKVGLLEDLLELELACIDDKDWSSLFINLMEACGHELSNDIFFAKEIVVQQHVDLQAMSPFGILFYGLQCLALVEFMSHQISDIDASFEYHLVDIIEYFGCIDRLSKVGDLLLLLTI